MLNAIIKKKLRRYFFSFLRIFYFKKNKLLFVNSLPKSGTYLLHNILCNSLCVLDYGNFIASRPTLTYKKREFSSLKKLFKNSFKNEFCLGHLEYSKEANLFFTDSNIKMILVIRDPRDVVISESKYLTHSNIYHKLHKYFKNLTSEHERINFAIHGNSYLKNCDVEFLPINKRYQCYVDWISNYDCLVVKYEDLIGNHRDTIIKKILIFLSKSYKLDNNLDDTLNNIKHSLEYGEKPHTFRDGKAGTWRDILSEKQKKWFLSEMYDELILLGYEKK